MSSPWPSLWNSSSFISLVASNFKGQLKLHNLQDNTYTPQLYIIYSFQMKNTNHKKTNVAMSSQQKDAAYSVRVQNCNGIIVRRADLNWASHLFVGNVWCTPRYLDVYVRPVESPFDLEDLLTFWTPCLVKGSVCIPALCIKAFINILFFLDSMVQPMSWPVNPLANTSNENAVSCVWECFCLPCKFYPHLLLKL